MVNSPCRKSQGKRAMRALNALLSLRMSLRKDYGADPFPSGVAIYHRRDLDEVQRELRDVKGVSVSDL